MVTPLRQRGLRRHGHVTRMKDGRIPKDMLYAELAEGKRATGRPHLRFNDVCKRDLKAIGIEVENWVKLAHDRNNWRSSLHTCTNATGVQLRLTAEAKRAAKKNREHGMILTNSDDLTCRCQRCDRACLSRIGLYSHTQRCRADESNLGENLMSL